jgi:Amidase
LKAGAIILGKMTLSELAAGDNLRLGVGVTRNSYDLERTVGGSSDGSGAALNANFSTVAISMERSRCATADAWLRQRQWHVGRLFVASRPNGADEAQCA